MLLSLGLLLPVLCAQAAGSYGMTLTGMQYPVPTSGSHQDVTVVPLRGPPGMHGNVWGLVDYGTNILPCGSAGNTEIYDRLPVEKGIDFNLMGRIWNAQGGEGSLIFSIKYGRSPDFRDPGLALTSYNPELAETPLNWVITTNIPEPAFSDNATIQVEYFTGLRPENWTDDFSPDNPSAKPWSSVYQCIDLSVTGAAPIPPGAGDNYNPTRYRTPTPQGSGTSFAPTASGGGGVLSPLEIGLIVLAIVLGLLAILLLVCCLLRKKKKQPPEEKPKPPQVQPDETAKPPVPPPPPGDGPVVHVHIEDGDPPSPPRPTEPPELEREGSHGRLFHFKYTYIDGDEDNEEEDRKVQRKTIERRATANEDGEDHKH